MTDKEREDLNTFRHELVKQAHWWQWKAKTLEKENEQLKAENAALRNEADENAGLSIKNKLRADRLENENAALRERLENAIEVPFVFNKKVFVIVHGEEGNFYLFEGIVTGIGTDTNKLYEGEIDLLMSVVDECGETHFINGKQYRKQWFCEDEIEYVEARLAELKGGKE